MRQWRLLLLDLLSVAAATVFALLLRENLAIDILDLKALLPYLVISLAVAVPILVGLGLNRSVWRLTAFYDFVRAAAAAAAIAIAATAIAFAYNRLEGLPRSLPVLQAMTLAFAFGGARALTRLHQLTRRKRAVAAVPHQLDTAATAVLVVGVNRLSDLYLQAARELGGGSLRIAGLLGAEHRVGRLVHGHEILGAPESLGPVLDRLEVHGIAVTRIIVTLPPAKLSAAANAALQRAESQRHVQLIYLTDMIGLNAATPRSADATDSRSIGTGTLDAALRTSLARPYWTLKRGLDILAAAGLLVLAAPLFAIVGLLVALDVGAPVLFWQIRPGRFGQSFRLYKFRTMGETHDASGQRIADKDRLSAIGRALRRCRLDELPQLGSILLGHMSFVGPRPLLPVDQPDADLTRLLVRPGLTGWAQVNGGRQIGANDKAALDLWYIKNASLRLDIRILWRTLLMLAGGERRNEVALELASRQRELEELAARQLRSPSDLVPQTVSARGEQRAA